MELLHSVYEIIKQVFLSLHLNDILDILIVTYIIYKGIKLIRETRAEQLVKGIIILLVLYFLAKYFKFRSLSFIMDHVFQLGILTLIVVFQPEIRKALEQFGRSKLGRIALLGQSETDIEMENKKIEYSIEGCCKSCTYLSSQKMGALIVFENRTKLGEIIKTGTMVDARPNADVISNIFFKNAPLHDGAAIIRKGRVIAAGCILPLSDNRDIGKELGTRHRAGLGISENSDAYVVIVSEETGYVTLAHSGRLYRNIQISELRSRLKNGLLQKVNTDSKDKKKKKSSHPKHDTTHVAKKVEEIIESKQKVSGDSKGVTSSKEKMEDISSNTKKRNNKNKYKKQSSQKKDVGKITQKPKNSKPQSSVTKKSEFNSTETKKIKDVNTETLNKETGSKDQKNNDKTEGGSK